MPKIIYYSRPITWCSQNTRGTCHVSINVSWSLSTLESKKSKNRTCSIWRHISTEPMGCPEWKNSIPALRPIRKTSLTFGRHVNQNNPYYKRNSSELTDDNSVDTMSCQPPVLLEDINTKGLSPDILVSGDIISKKYDFMMGDLDNNPYKIAQVSCMIT